MASARVTREAGEILLTALTACRGRGRMGRFPRLMTESGHDVTALLHAWTAGDSAARDQLMTVVYQELRRRAAGQLRGERRGHTLQPTALVHEAYVRLVDQRRMVWQNRGQFFGVACQMMRRILVDHARAHRMAKRSGQWARVTLDEAARATPRLAAFDPRKCQLAELRFFGGLSLKEAGEAVGSSMATAERDWQAARSWLLKELRGERPHDA